MPSSPGEENLNDIGRELRGSRCLSLSEVVLLLEEELKQNVRRTPQASELIKLSYQYSCKFAKIRQRQSILDARLHLEKYANITELEMAALLNLLPRQIDEAKILVPSLTRYNDADLSQMIEELENFRLYGS